MKCDVRTGAHAVDVLILPDSAELGSRIGSQERLAKSAAYLVASMLEQTAANEGRPYTITVTGLIVRCDFASQLDAPETRDDASDIASEIMIEACSAAGLEPTEESVRWPGDPGSLERQS
jgi:hypothetical protein